MTSRRPLQFDSWQQVREDLTRLQSGYQAAGKWDLETTANHLNDWLGFPIDGFPRAPLAVRCVFAVLRSTRGQTWLKQILAEKRMRDGMPTLPETVRGGADSDGEQQAVSRLLATIDRFETFKGQIQPSPIYGPMDKQTAQALQWVHFAHHLSWLIPDETPPRPSEPSP
ncbi:MAG: DUF1569 domain-containing protein [Planctomycetota bacterium]|nr:MAG: DUF1569 domain-containing protein [Planctomycetota bacterium]